MVEAAVNPIVDIISRLWTCCERHTRYLRKLQENKILLSTAMDELKEARDDVQRRVVQAEADQNEPKKRTDQVRGWIQSVENIEREVEVILQTTDEQLSSTRCHEKDKLVVMKKAYVDELKEKGHFEELTYRLPPSSVQDMNLESIVGMESMFDEVWRLVTSTDDKPVGLYGQGGVGKTTLLKKINNKISTGEQHGFDHVVIFVVVSKLINYENIQKKIGDRLGLSLEEDEDETSRAQKIFNVLSKKNYVLLFDDIWEKVDKKRIGIPIHHDPQGNSSKLIFTTRSERVCGLMEATHTFQVECLPWDKAWRLFQDKVGENALTSFPEARELAKDVAKECGGLPLALITIGRAMSTKKSVQEWRDATATLGRYASTEFEGTSDEVILPCLKLCYDYLHNETEKSCFRYCALFPEDHSIEIAKLVKLWIAEGFFDGIDKLDEARDRGHTIIGSLKSACLLESSDEHNHVKMHDVIRDMALWIVNDCRSSDESSNSNSNSDNNKFLVAGNDPCKKWVNAERIFWDATHYTTSSSSNHPLRYPNLQTLIVRKAVMDNVFRWPQNFFQNMPLLKVLDLSNNAHCFYYEFPISICELHELQYLNLSGTSITELPVEFKKLVKLKFLVLRLSRIPAGVIANLSELQVLDLKSHDVEDWELEDRPSFSELDDLKQLQEVRITISTYDVLEKFLCNRKLQMVCTSLIFMKAYKSLSSSSRRVLDMSNFKSLKDLILIEFSEVEELVLYGRYNNTTDGGLLCNLESLALRCFPKLNNILWMAAQPSLLRSPFQNLYVINISCCNALKDLKWLVYVKNLKILSVNRCKGLEIIIELSADGLEGVAGEVFGRLETLYMKDLPKLKSICSRHALAFPYVKTIKILECPELKKLPLDSSSNVNNTLNEIVGSTEWWNQLEWEDETIKSKFLPYYEEGFW